jgi:hypothetical protein
MILETGDIILVKVNKFSTWYRWLLAKLIQFFEGVYYHHACAIVGGLIYEADTRVVRRSPVHLNGQHVVVLRLKKPLSDRERNMYKFLANQCLDREYDYWGVLLHQLIYILTFRRIWIGKTHSSANSKPYCTEFSVHMIHRLRGYFPTPWKTGPTVLLQLAPLYYEVVFEGTFEA